MTQIRENASAKTIIYIVGNKIDDKEKSFGDYTEIKITVPDAVEKVKNINGIQITSASGGNGAFREVTDCLINS